MQRVTTVVQRGLEAGTVLYAHRYRNGHFVASRTRYKEDQIEVPTEKALIDHIRRGYAIRMSNPQSKHHRAPSLIQADRIQIVDE